MDRLSTWLGGGSYTPSVDTAGSPIASTPST
jgi:hypothetical protein